MITMAQALPRERSAELPETATMDEAVFHHLYRRTARPLRAYLLRSSGDLALAEDLLQETYLRMLKSGFEGEDERHRRNYLYRIATNLLRDHHRRARPQTDRVPERDERPVHDVGVHLRSDVGSAMAEIGSRDRQMLWLAYVEGATHEEIAGIMELKPSSVRSMLFRARTRLAKVLRERGLRPGVEGS
jgi:RNA polymerase sigma-70 factor (ECF subfamily)